MRGVLSALHERLSVTTVYVTHDQIEAMTLGDRVAVLAEGRLQQVDTPQRLFDAPSNLFVAGFIGSPAMNMVTARLSAEVSGLVVRFGSHTIPLPGRFDNDRLRALVDHDVVVGIRPSDFLDPTHGSGAAGGPEGLPAGTLPARIANVEELGSEIHAMFEIDAPPVVSAATKSLSAADTAEEEALSVTKGHSLWTARLSPSVQVKPGQQIALRLDVERLHLFDCTTGQALGHPAARTT
jgi:multiple sugar transport system ATP-binding protein